MFGKFNMKNFCYATENNLINRTNDFLTIFHDGLEHKPTFVIMNLGGKGSGKTATSFIEMCLLLQNLSSACVIWWKAPPNWIEKVNSYCPSEWKGKFHSVSRIREINTLLSQFKYVIFMMDESVRDMNAKQALTKGARRFEKAVVLFRQKNVFFIYNAQIENVTKSMRTLTDLTIYKGNTHRAISESEDSFAHENKDYLISLFNPKKKPWALFLSSYSHFLKNNYMITEGRFRLSLDDYCSWYNDDLSKGYEDASLDEEYDEFENINLDIQIVADLFEKDYPDIKMTLIKTSLIRGWLRKKYPERFYDAQDYIQGVVDELVTRAVDKHESEKDDSDSDYVASEKWKDVIAKDAQISNECMIAGTDFAAYCKEYFKADPPNQKIVFGILSGLGQAEIARQLGIADGKVNSLWKDIQNKQIGAIFEKWVALNFDGIRFAEKSYPDVITRSGHILSCKFKYESKIRKIVELDQDADLDPERKLADFLNVQYYLVMLYVRWGAENQIKIIKVNPKARRIVDIEKTTPSVDLKSEPPIEFLAKIMNETDAESSFRKFFIAAGLDKSNPNSIDSTISNSNNQSGTMSFADYIVKLNQMGVMVPQGFMEQYMLDEAKKFVANQKSA